MKRVLVVLQATDMKTEQMALAFGLGAVEGGANIRLRHVPGPTPAVLEHKGYGSLTDRDLDWADLIGLAIEAPEPVGEVVDLVQRIKQWRETAGDPTKHVYLFGPATETQSMEFVAGALKQLGFTLIDAKGSIPSDPEALKAVGRKAGDLA